MARRRLEPLTEYRQSLLSSAEACMRRTRHTIEVGDDLTLGWVGDTGDLGTVFHAIVAEMLRTMWRYGYTKMGEHTEEAVNIAREVYAGMDIVLPTESRHILRSLIFAWCQYEFDTSRILALERPIRLDVQCPDGEIRTLKGQPDLIVRDGTEGVIIWDWKTGKGKPKKPREATPDDQPVVGKQYLSERGHFQLDTYGLLAMRGVLEDGTMLAEGIRHATLRELHLRWGGTMREATISVDDLEHIVPDLADHMMKLDRGIQEGPKSALWKARPGSHCLMQCPVARSCPVPREMRGVGELATQAQADAEAEVFVKSGAREEQARLRLKAWEEAGNPPGRVNDREEVRWGPERDMWMRKGDGRKFAIWPAKNGEPRDA